MKKLLTGGAFLLLSTVLLATHRPAAAVQAAQGQGQSIDARVATLETDLAAMRAKLDETHAQLEQTLAYLEKQSKAAERLVAALDEAEQQGFAVGENWKSRQTLLAGMRAYCGDQQNGVPKAPAATKTVPAKPAPAQQRQAKK